MIDADEVKAAHGATVGQLDATALFYLRSRGIPRDEARALLTRAFLVEAIEVAEQPALIETLTDALIARIEGAAL